MRTARILPLVLPASLALCLGALGCQKKDDGKPSANGDANSGADANRSGATLILVNKDYTDRVDIKAGDQTDWKMVELKGKSDALTVDIRWDNAQADVALDAFDPSGAQIASSPQNAGVPAKKLIVPIENTPGTYYLRIQSLTPKEGTDYTLNAHWEGVEGKEPVAAEEPKPRPRPQHTTPPPSTPTTPKPRKAGKGKAEDGLQGRVVSARKEGEGMVLFIDKGKAAGVSEGQNGWILEGPSGFTEFGTFTVSAVVDDNRSIGKTSLKSIGKNNRVSINVPR